MVVDNLSVAFLLPQVFSYGSHHWVETADLYGCLGRETCWQIGHFLGTIFSCRLMHIWYAGELWQLVYMGLKINNSSHVNLNEGTCHPVQQCQPCLRWNCIYTSCSSKYVNMLWRKCKAAPITYSISIIRECCQLRCLASYKNVDTQHFSKMFADGAFISMSTAAIIDYSIIKRWYGCV